MISPKVLIALLATLVTWNACLLAKNLSHPTLRHNKVFAKEAVVSGAKYVDAQKGADSNPGTEDKPWKHVSKAMLKLKAGDTLYLRAGVYREQLVCSLQGTREKPIAILGYPGEQVILDGSLGDFQENAKNAWVKADDKNHLYRSTKSYPNIRDVIGCFLDSHVGLQTYKYRVDLEARNETITMKGKWETEPMYCGPGLWYDKASGHVYARLAHTNIKHSGAQNYRGERDPRINALVIAPYRSTPLLIDQAEHVTIKNLIIRGGGYRSTVVRQSRHIRLEQIIIRGGTYGMIVRNTQHFKLLHSAIYGNIPPWGFRFENSLEEVPDREGARDIARLTQHACFVAKGGDEYSVFQNPFNRDWEVAYCEFTEGHDGVYVGGVENFDFHHNLVENFQDDGIYLSPMGPNTPQKAYVHHNMIRRSYLPLAFGGTHPPYGPIYIYNNIVELLMPLQVGRPHHVHPLREIHGRTMGDHGSPKWGELHLFHNTFIAKDYVRRFLQSTVAAAPAGIKRSALNNIYVYLKGGPKRITEFAANNKQLIFDGNLHWYPGSQVDPIADFKQGKVYQNSKSHYKPGLANSSTMGDPQFTNFNQNGNNTDYSLKAGSPAIGRAVALPAYLKDILSQSSKDAGAIPAGQGMFRFGLK